MLLLFKRSGCSSALPYPLEEHYYAIMHYSENAGTFLKSYDHIIIICLAFLGDMCYFFL
mgnify:CR=1 FL=1|jgi:hypothetical protein